VSQSLATVVPLHQTDHLWSDLALVLEPTDLQAGMETKGDFGVRISEFLLNELERREGTLELVTL
jgi:hypothetical protein